MERVREILREGDLEMLHLAATIIREQNLYYILEEMVTPFTQNNTSGEPINGINTVYCLDDKYVLYRRDKSNKLYIKTMSNSYLYEWFTEYWKKKCIYL